MTLAKGAPTVVISALASIAASATSAISTSSLDTTTSIQVAAEVLMTNGAATFNPNAQLLIFGSMDDSNYTTQPIATYDIVLEASATTRQEFSVMNAPRYLKAKVKNLDTAIAITTISVSFQTQTVS